VSDLTTSSEGLRDEDVRTSCMAQLSILIASFGEDVPYVNGLERGFPFRGSRVPYLNRQKGIYRAAVQRGPAALAIQTSAKSPYDDEILADGFAYAYRAGSIDQSDNRALRAAYELQVPLVYFIGTRPGWYKPVFPCFVRADDSAARRVTVTPGALRGPLDELEPVPLEDPIERRYAVRETRVRCIKRGSEVGWSLRTAASAQSALSRNCGCWTRRTSWGTSNSPGNRP